MKQLGRLILEMLRELADESAYKRYLEKGGRVHSGEEWRRFADRRLHAKYSRAKCC
jgi:hypothetical protein